MRQKALWSAAAEDAVTHRLGTLVEMEVARKRADGTRHRTQGFLT